MKLCELVRAVAEAVGRSMPESENAVKAYLQANLLQAEYPIYLDYLAIAAIQSKKQRYLKVAKASR